MANALLGEVIIKVGLDAIEHRISTDESGIADRCFALWYTISPTEIGFPQLNVTAIEIALLDLGKFVQVDQNIAHSADLPIGVFGQIGHVVIGLKEIVDSVKALRMGLSNRAG